MAYWASNILVGATEMCWPLGNWISNLFLPCSKVCFAVYKLCFLLQLDEDDDNDSSIALDVNLVLKLVRKLQPKLVSLLFY